MNETLKVAAQELKKGVNITVVDARFAKPLDENLIWQLATTHEAIMTIEEGFNWWFWISCSKFFDKKRFN